MNLRQHPRFTFLFMAGLLLFCVSLGNAWAQPSIITDQSDYPPRSTALISGGGFQPGESVQCRVLRIDVDENSGREHHPWVVTADDTGSVQTTWYVTPDEAGATLQLTATGLSSGWVAQMTFTDGTVTVATGGAAISADATGGTYTSLTGPTYTEANVGDVSISGGSGTITLKCPSGFQFDTNTPLPNILVTGDSHSGKNINQTASGSTFAVTSVKTNAITITITDISRVPNTLKWQNLRVRPVAGTPLASGNLTVSFTNAAMVGVTAGTTSFGTLTEVAGAASKLAFTTQPGSATYGALLSPQPVLKSQDQFGNASTTGLAASKLATLTLTAGTGPLAGTASLDIGTSAGNGTLTFTNLQVKAAGTGKQLTAAASGLTSALSATFTVAQATVTVTADDKTRTYGAANPAFTASYGGFVNGDTAAVLSGTPSLTTAAAVTSVAGPYPILAAVGTLSAANYSFTFVAGTLTITPAGSAMTLGTSANPVSTGSNVTFTATLGAAPQTPVAPAAGLPTGSVQFLADGSPLGSPVAINNGIATLVSSSLSHGYHTIAAQYPGDGNFSGTTGSLLAGQLVNAAPIPGFHTLGAVQNTAANLQAAKLLLRDKDPDGDAVSLTAVSAASAQGGSVSLSAGIITYTPALDYVGADTFTYTIADTFGATATGTVSVTVSSSDAPNQTVVSLVPLPDGTKRLTFAGIPGRTYFVQATPSLSPPAWTTIATNVAGTNGLFSYIDSQTSIFSSRYYRTATP